MRIKKQMKFTWPNGSRPDMVYTIVFGDYIDVQWPDSGSSYWHSRTPEVLERIKNERAYIRGVGTVNCLETGITYKDEEEFLHCMKLLRAERIPLS